MITTTKIQELKSQVNLVELFKSYGYEVQKKGTLYLTLCPFHKEETPSLSINPDKKLWQCFGCGESGDAISFIQKMEKLNFTQSVKFLALKNGIVIGATCDVQRATEKDGEVCDRTTARLHDSTALMNKVAGFYHRVFIDSEAGKAYLQKRGITKEAIYTDYKIGFADGSLLKSLPQNHEMRQELRELGILLENGKERFLNCVVFPLFNEAGDCVSFYGRHIEMEKGGHFYLPGLRAGLFNYRQLKEKQIQNERLIITESVIDALSFIEHDMPDVLALYGTNGFTDDHLSFLTATKLKEIVLALDGDEPGQKATQELETQLKEKLFKDFSFNCLKITFPSNQDANEYFQTHNRTDFESLLKGILNKTPNLYLTNEAELKKITEEKNDSTIARADDGTTKYQLKFVELKQGKLNVTIKAENAENGRFVLDTLNLYSSRQRENLIGEASKLFSQKKEVTEKEINELIKLAETKAKTVQNSDQNQIEETTPTITESDKAEALAFLKSPDIFSKIGEAYDKIGYIGEETNKVLAYLVMTSRKMKNPLSMVIMSNSAAGKSSLQKATLMLCPEEEGKHFTRLTQQSLFYLGNDSLKHKFLSIEEEEGSSEASYSLKTLLSAKVLNVVSTTQDPATGKRKADEYRTEGPVAVMVSTTSPELEAELASRTLIISVDESQNQTQNIQDMQKQSRTKDGQLKRRLAEPVIKKHQNAQRLLNQNLTVINNYAPQLTFPVNRLKFRRSHDHYLDLIDTIAFLRQYQKDVKSEEVKSEEDIKYIEVDKEDIRLANDIFIQVLGWTIDELSPPTRLLLKQIVTHCKEGGNLLFTKREIRERFSWGYTHLFNHLKRLAELEYVVAVNGTNGTVNYFKLLYEGDGECEEKMIIGLKNPKDLV